MKPYLLLIIFFLITRFLPAQDFSTLDFHLLDVNGSEQTFQGLMKQIRGAGEQPKNGALVISFWTVWCNSCKQEMKSVKELYEKYKDKNLHYLAINNDNIKSSAKVKAFVSAQDIHFPVWLDPNGEVFNKLNGAARPYLLIIDSRGKLVAKKIGFLLGDEKEIEKDIRKILN